MKYLILFCLSLFTLSGYAQENKTITQIKITPEVYDFGVFKEEAGVVKAKFTITNISKKPYIMNYSYSGCGCVSSKITKEPLMPGKSRVVEVEYNPKRRPGVFNKEVVLVSNNKQRGDLLKVRGEVIPRPKSVEELYPIKTVGGLLLSDDKFALGILSQNEKHIAVINLFNGSKSTVRVEAKCLGDALGNITLSTTEVAPNREAQLQFYYDLRNNTRYGELKNNIELYVNGVKWKEKIDINALVIFNFFEMSDNERRIAPRAIIAPTEYSVKTGERVEIPILNNGKSDLVVLDVIEKGIKSVFSSKTIKAGQEGKMTLTLTDSRDGDLTLLFNSPDTPVVIIKLKTK